MNGTEVIAMNELQKAGPHKGDSTVSRFGWTRLALVVVLVAHAGSEPGSAAILDVTPGWTFDAIDLNPGDGECRVSAETAGCTLRAAIMEANALSSKDTIRVPEGHYLLSLAGTGEDSGHAGDLDVLVDTTIRGDLGATAATVIDAQGIDRVFDVHAASTLHLERVTITGGQVAGAGWSGSGGGILARGRSLILDTVLVDRNRATRGGGIYLASRFGTLLDSAVTNNVVEAFGSVMPSGGGLLVAAPAELVQVSSSTIAGNRCGGGGAGGCDGAAGVAATDCVPNTSLSWASLLVDNSTVSGNTPGGLWLDDCGGHLRSSTIVDNQGGGLNFAETFDSGWALLVERSIVSANAPDCGLQSSGAWLLAGNRNLDFDWTCGLLFGLDRPGTDPMLHPLGHFDPPSDRVALSHHPRWGSPVVDGSPWGTPFDQDRYPRPLDGNDHDGVALYDLGSIEVLPCNGPSGLPDVNLDHVLPGLIPSTDAQVIEACRTIITGDSVAVQNNSPVRFWARDSIVIGNGFSVVDGADFAAGFVRWAGYVP